MTDRTVRTIAQRLSLRSPQAASLEILADVLERIELSKDADPAAALAAIREAYPQVGDFEREFPIALLRSRDRRRQDAADGRVHLLSLPDRQEPPFLRARSQQDDLREADFRLLSREPEVCLQGHCRVRRQPAPHHHWRQLRKRPSACGWRPGVSTTSSAPTCISTSSTLTRSTRKRARAASRK